MKQQKFIDELICNPVIAAVRDDHHLEQAILSKVGTVFLLSGSINSLKQACAKVKLAGRLCFLHVDLIEGLRPDQQGLRFIAENIGPNGIITTKSACVKWAQAVGLLTVQRIFMLDSTAVHDGLRNILACQPDLVEIMPGVSEKAIRMACDHFKRPLIAGGLISSPEEVRAALAAGALAVSTSEASLWEL